MFPHGTYMRLGVIWYKQAYSLAFLRALQNAKHGAGDQLCREE